MVLVIPEFKVVDMVVGVEDIDAAGIEGAEVGIITNELGVQQ